MSRSRFLIFGVFAIVLLKVLGPWKVQDEPVPLPWELSTSGSAVAIAFSAPFNTESWDERDPALERFDLPVLYLHREREPALDPERTLEIHIAGLAWGPECRSRRSRATSNLTIGAAHNEPALPCRTIPAP